MKAGTLEIGKKEEGFSLLPGGALFTLLRRLHLCEDAMQWLRRRIVIFVILTWLLLLLLTAWEGTSCGGTRLPFLIDVNLHSRLLLALPLLLFAELTLHRRMVVLVRLFVDRGLVPPEARREYEGAVRSATRMRD